MTCRKLVEWPELRSLPFEISAEDCAYRPNSCKRKRYLLWIPQWLKISKAIFPTGLQHKNQRLSLKLLGCASIWWSFDTDLVCLQNGNEKNMKFHPLCPVKEKHLHSHSGWEFIVINCIFNRKWHSYTVCLPTNCDIILNVLTAPKYAPGLSKNKITNTVWSNQIKANQ